MKKLLIALTLLTLSCTENVRARQFGGSQTIALPSNTRLVNATWKETDLWLLTRPAKPGEDAQTYKFFEKSNFGLMEGTIVIVESK